MLSSIFLIWPSSMGNLISATLDSDSIWTGTSSYPSAMLSSLTGTASYKTISSGQTRTLWLNFQGIPGQLIGDNNIETHVVSSSPGQARAYSFTPSASGKVTTFNLYVDSGSTSTNVAVGLYSSNTGNTHPATLLSTGSLSSPTKGAWNAITISSVSLTAGTTYWIAVLSPSGKSTLKFRDISSGSSERSSSGSLTALPTTWASGSSYSESKISAYLTGYISGSTRLPIMAFA